MSRRKVTRSYKNLVVCTTGHRALFRTLDMDRFYERPVVGWAICDLRGLSIDEDDEEFSWASSRTVAMVSGHNGLLRRAMGIRGFLCVLDPHEMFEGILKGKGASKGASRVSIKTKRRGVGLRGDALTSDLEFCTPLPNARFRP